MADPNDGTPVGGRQAVQETLREGVGSVNTEQRHTGEVHEIGPNDDLAQAVSNYAGEIIDLMGRTYEIDSELTVSTARTKLQNGTIELADGANSDILSVTANHVTLEGITIDYNGTNNSGLPETNGYVDATGDYVTFRNCEFVNSAGREGNTVTGWYTKGDHFRVEGCRFNFGNEQHIVDVDSESNSIEGGTIINSTIRDCLYYRYSGRDVMHLGNHIDMNYQGIRVDENAQDGHFIGNKIEDNGRGIVFDGFGRAPGSSEQLQFSGNSIQGNEQEAVLVPSGVTMGGNVTFSDNSYKLNQLGGSGGAIFKVESDCEITFSPETIDNYTDQTLADHGWVLANTTDANIDWDKPFSAQFGTAVVDDGGARTRWDGVIGGGPLGGVDLSTTTGQFVGDEARADGTSAAAENADAIWNGTGWDYRNVDGTV